MEGDEERKMERVRALKRLVQRDWYGLKKEWQRGHEDKDGDRDNRWGWIGWDRGSERLRDVSVTADCADIDPSLVLCPQETGSQRETRGCWDTERLQGDRWANQEGENDRNRRREVTACLFWFHQSSFTEHTVLHSLSRRTMNTHTDTLDYFLRGVDYANLVCDVIWILIGNCFNINILIN